MHLSLGHFTCSSLFFIGHAFGCLITSDCDLTSSWHASVFAIRLCLRWEVLEDMTSVVENRRKISLRHTSVSDLIKHALASAEIPCFISLLEPSYLSCIRMSETGWCIAYSMESWRWDFTCPDPPRCSCQWGGNITMHWIQSFSSYVLTLIFTISYTCSCRNTIG